MARPRPVIHKAYRPFELKSVDVDARRFTGLASTWSLDLDGEVIERGAFARSLDHWRGSAKLIIPLIDQHNYDSVRHVFGKLETAAETDVGLETEFSVVASPEGDEYLARISGGFLNGLSIGFSVVDRVREERVIGGETVTVPVIKELRLMEVSAVIWGANPEALIDLAAAKALLAPARTRTLSPEEVEGLRALRGEIDALLPVPALAPTDPARLRLDALAREVLAGAVRTV